MHSRRTACPSCMYSRDCDRIRTCISDYVGLCTLELRSLEVSPEGLTLYSVLVNLIRVDIIELILFVLGPVAEHPVRFRLKDKAHLALHSSIQT